MSENRKCVNCRHNIRKEKSNGNIGCVCEITNTNIGYVKCFEHWCRHWAKEKDGKQAKFMVIDELDRMKQTALKGKQDVWLRNLTSLKMGEFGIDTKSPETLLAYWKAQALAGYPLAEENVRYFEDMVRKNVRNGSN